MAQKQQQQQGSSVTFDMVVAQNGSANFKTIGDAIKAAASNSSTRINIKIMAGVYQEYVVVPQDKTNLAFFGEGIDKTIITGNRNKKLNNIQTEDSATVGIYGSNFLAQDLTIENTAGPQGEQAVALLSEADHSVFYRCKISGYQDTLYARRNIQFYRECDIYGTVDFIFGDAKVVLQCCNVYARKPESEQFIAITAQGKVVASDPTGTVLHNCIFKAMPELINAGFPVSSYLGRPWKDASTTIVMQSYLDWFIDPKGWTDWDQNRTLNKLPQVFYAEYDNRGPRKDTGSRFPKRVLSEAEASKFTVGNFIDGDRWLPATGVPYDAALLVDKASL